MAQCVDNGFTDGCPISNPGGIDVDESACVGIGLSNDDWVKVWNTGKCTDVYQCVMFSKDGMPIWNPNNLPCAQNEIETVFKMFLQTYKISSPGDDGYSSMQENLLNLCTTVPSVCEKALTVITDGSLCQGRSREEVAGDAPLLNFCGCFPSESTTPNESQCDPLCDRIGNIPVSDDQNGVFVFCNRGVCVISDTSIEATETSLGGGSVNFFQICSNCGDGGCDCIISASEEMIDTVEGGNNITQICQNCFLAVSGGAVPVECKSVIPQKEDNTTGIAILFVILIVGFLFFFIALVLYLIKR